MLHLGPNIISHIPSPVSTDGPVVLTITCATIPEWIQITGVTMDSVSYEPQTIVTSIASDDNYQYGFNRQMKTNEIAGVGNHNTALFWEYDTRIGKRLNIDPKNNPWESSYATFGGNPIWHSDVLGNKSNFYDKNSTLVKHVDDGFNAQYQQKGNNENQHYEFKGFDESQGGKNVVNLTTAIQESQNLNMDNPSLVPNSATYCNYGTQNILQTVASATNNSTGLNITGKANSMVVHFENSPALQTTTADDALQNAQNGSLSLYGHVNTNPPPHNHGHVGSFSVGDNVAKGETANIGSNNGFLSLGPGQKGPSPTRKPEPNHKE